MPDADALTKSQGTSSSKYGSATKDLVCGDRLCSEPESSSEPIMGGDKDKHGCIGTAGYQWSENEQKCIRPWENTEAFDSENKSDSLDSSSDEFTITDDTSVEDIEDHLELLFVMTGSSGTIKPISDDSDSTHMLTINDVSKSTVYFSDRPARISGHMPTQDLIDIWNVGEDDFQVDPPNVSIEIFDGDDVITIVAELTNPIYDAETDSITFNAIILSEGDLPEEFGAVALFIDNWFKKTWKHIKHSGESAAEKAKKAAEKAKKAAKRAAEKAKKEAEKEAKEAKKEAEEAAKKAKELAEKTKKEAELLAKFTKKLGTQYVDFAKEVIAGDGHYSGAKMDIGYCKDDSVWVKFNHKGLLWLTWKGVTSVIPDKLGGAAGDKAIKKAVSSASEEEGAAEESSADNPIGAIIAAYVAANYVAMITIDDNNGHDGAYINVGIKKPVPSADSKACVSGTSTSSESISLS